MFPTGEFVFNKPKLFEINITIKNTQLKYEQKYGYNYYTKVYVKCNVKIFDEKENKTKKTMIERENVVGEVKKKMKSSKGCINLLELSN